MRITNTDGATNLNYEGVDYEADETSTFDLPEEVGHALIGFPHWLHEYEALALADAKKAAADLDPHNQAGRLAELEALLKAVPSDVENALRAELEEAKGKLAAAEAKLARKAPAKKAAGPVTPPAE